MYKPSEPSLKHFKKKCICCEKENKPMSKEHIFPQWLLKMTGNNSINFNWIYGKIPAYNCTVPLCTDCNSILGQQLEAPVKTIFENIEKNEGFNDYDAELIIRWMWKVSGMFYWSICNDHWLYGYMRLFDKVLKPIDMPRNRLSLAISLIKDSYQDYGYAPIGLDSVNIYSNVLSAGVFSNLSIIVFYSFLEDYFDSDKWTIYNLSNYPFLSNSNYKIKPKTSFATADEAISYTIKNAGYGTPLFYAHENIAINQKSMYILRGNKNQPTKNPVQFPR